MTKTGKYTKINGSTFYGQKISDYGLKNHRVDYRALSQAFDCVMNNYIMEKTDGIGYWEQVHGGTGELEERLEELRERAEEIDDDISYADEDEDTSELQEELGELNEQIEELENELSYPNEIFQYFIIDESGAEILEAWTNEIVFYNEELDMYVWGVTHLGTAWDYVLTDIEVEEGLFS